MTSDFIAASYGEARAKFIKLVGHMQAQLASWVMPGGVGAAGEALATDVAYIGPEAPRAVFVLTSGTHGIEGYTGSMVQAWALSQDKFRSDTGDLGFALVHAINPFGFSHGHRVNEDNIDLNRNFVDFAGRLPDNIAYDRLHSAILPKQWDGPERERADRVLQEAWRALGERGFQDVVCHGQYGRSDGVFFGGRRPAWSNIVWRSILASLPQSAALIAHLDIHTGLGPYGYGELMYTLPSGIVAHELALDWYSDLGFRAAGTSESSATPVGGTMNHAVLGIRPDVKTMSISLEFGTVEFPRMFEAVRASNWLMQMGAAATPDAEAVRRELKACFFPDDGEWRRSVIARCDEIIERTLTRVAALLAGHGH